MYNWDLEDFRKKREYLVRLRKEKRKKLSEDTLSVINDAIATYDLLLGTFNDDNYYSYDDDLNDRIFVSKYFINMYHSINKDIVTSVNDSCFVFEEIDIPIEEKDGSFIELKTSIDMCREIFSSFDDPELMTKVNTILDENNHLLDIVKNDEYVNLNTLYSGFSIKDNYNKTGYAKIYSNNKIRDLYTLVHEIFHLVIDDNNKIITEIDDSFYLEEIEGAFSDLIVTDYLYRNKVFVDEARMVEALNYNNTKDFVRNVFISSNYHQYLKEDSFDLRSIKRDLISKRLPFIGFDRNIMRDNLLSFNRDLCYSFSYLVALDLFFKYKNGYKNIISDLEGISKGKNPFIMLERYNVNFHKDGYKNLDSYQKILQKEKR